MSYKVGVVVRTKNRPLLLKRAINSILNQSYKDWEILLVNNGGNIEELNQVLNEFKYMLGDKFKLFNIGTQAFMEVATNTAIFESQNELVALLDDDDTWAPNFLETCVGELENDATLIGVVSQTTLVYEEIKNGVLFEYSREVFNQKLKKVSILRLAQKNLFTTNAFVYRKKLVHSIGFYREDLPVLGDWEFNLRVTLGKNKIKVVPMPLAYYHKRVGKVEGAYSNSNIELHYAYDCKIRKEYLFFCFKKGMPFKGFLVYIYGLINLVKRYMKRLIKK